MKKIILTLAYVFALATASFSVNAQTYRSSTDMFGTTHTTGSNGYHSRTTTDMFGTNHTTTSNGTNYRTSTDMFGTTHTTGSNGSPSTTTKICLEHLIPLHLTERTIELQPICLGLHILPAQMEAIIALIPICLVIP